MRAIIELIVTIGDLLIYVLIAQAIMSWLIAFGVINTYNRAVYSFVDILNKISDPLLRPIRRIIPNLGGIDISPVILILLIRTAVNLVRDNAYALLSP